MTFWSGSKKEIELLNSISFKKNVPSHSSQNRKSNGTQSIILLDSELFRSIDNLKSELHSTISNLKETNSYNKEQYFFYREKLFLDFFSKSLFHFSFVDQKITAIIHI